MKQERIKLYERTLTYSSSSSNSRGSIYNLLLVDDLYIDTDIKGIDLKETKMSYEKGTLMVDESWREANKITAALPHSCDDWEIGGLEEIDNLIADLKEAKKEIIRLEAESIKKA